MSITTFTVNGIAVETTDASLVMSILGLQSEPIAAQQPKAEVAKQRRSAKPKQSKRQPKAAAPKVDRSAVLAEVRRLYRGGDFDGARAVIPKGWVQVFGEVDRAEARFAAKAASQEPKAAGKPKAPKQRSAKPKQQPKAEAAKPPKSKAKRSAKPKSAPKSVPTGTDEVGGGRVTSAEQQSLTDWKNLYAGKVNDLLAQGDPNEIALGYAELTLLIDALDVEADKVDPKDSGRLIAKACFLADQVTRLAEFDGAMA